MNFKISTIMPVYNSEKYIRQAIESLLNQTYKNIELIIVDDGSTDNSLSIIKEYANIDSRIRWFHQRNKGGSKALNFGISKATGDLIHFLDSDDYIKLDAYEKIINEFYNNPEIDCCMFSYKTIDENNKITSQREMVKEKTKTNLNKNPNLLIRYDSAQWMKIVKKEVIFKNKIKFDNTFFGYDLLFHLNIIQSTGSILVLPNHFIYYRTSNLSSSSGFYTRSKYYNIHFKCFKHCVKLYNNKNNEIKKCNIIHQFEILLWYLDRNIEKYKKRNEIKLKRFKHKLNKRTLKIIDENDSIRMKYKKFCS